MMAPPIIVTEDTPPDMLAGSMDLTVVLPDNHALKMSVERSTPMMDLLVQVTTANKLSPAGFIIKPLSERGTLPYKPSTPIGALDAWTIHVVPKQHAQCTSIRKSLQALNQPFEQTFRLQVHLPRNQLYVARVSPKTRLADILLQVCSEKNLDSHKYSLRHPNNLDQVLSLSCTLADYKLQELTLVCNRTHPVEVSTVDIMSLQRETSNPAYRNTLCEGSVSSGSLEGRSLSPVPSDTSSASPPPLPLPPSRPTRKRRPAPKPPTINLKSTNEENELNGIQSSTVINHSRNSSDSSGYHEASVLSESPQSNNVSETLSRRKMTSVTEDPGSTSLSQSLTDVTAIQPPLQQATSYSSLSSITGRKKKTAPPPPPPSAVGKKKASSVVEDQHRTPSVSSTASSTTTLDGNEVTVAVKSATLPPSSRLNSVPACPSSSPLPPPVYQVPPPTPPVEVEPRSSTPQVPPAPRPRSLLVCGGGSPCQADRVFKNKPPSPKKVPAPQPKPRKLLTVSSSTSNDPERELSKHNVNTKHLAQDTLSQHCDNRVVDPVKIQSHDERENQYKLCEENQSKEVGGGENRCESLDDGPHVNPQPALVKEPNSGRVAASVELRMADEEIDRIFTNATENHTSPESEDEELVSLSKLPSPPSLRHESPKQNTLQVEDSLDWEYKLPAPPTFRDESKSPSVTEFGTITVANFSEVLCPDKVKEDCNIELHQTDECDCRSNESAKSVVIIRNSNENKSLVQCRKGSRGSSDDLSSNLSAKEYEQRVVDELSTALSRKQSKSDINEFESRHQTQEIASSSTLDNFVITTYKDKKPIEVFEDESIKSSAGEKRDKSKDDAVFRAPKPRVKEPNLSRTSSFSLENKLNGPVIKRSVSYVSLLAANMPRNSQPYRAHLSATRGQLRKTTSEINIDSKDDDLQESSFWRSSNDQSELQSVQVLRNILSRSHANLSCSADESTSNIDSDDQHQKGDPPVSEERFEDLLDTQFGDSRKWRRSHSEDDEVSQSTHSTGDSKFKHSSSLDEEHSKPFTQARRGPPSIKLSTWNERPKREISIKDDGDYTFGIGRKSIKQDEIQTSTKVNDMYNLSKVCPKENILNEKYGTNQVGFQMGNRSKSISDLSRVPIVRAVELKKPFAAYNYDQQSLKSIEQIENINSSNQSEKIINDERNNNSIEFIGVNSLARKFGISQKKRPVSLYDTSCNTNNIFTGNKDSSGIVFTKIGNKFSSYNNANTIDRNILTVGNKNLETQNEAQLKLSALRKKPDTTAEIKALAKIRSGGFVEDNPNSAPFSQSSLKSVEKTSLKRLLSCNEDNFNNYKSCPRQFDKKNSITSLNGSEAILTSSVLKPAPPSTFQTNRSYDRPVNLQPVVKGFKVTIDTSTSLLKDSGPSTVTGRESASSRNNESPVKGSVHRTSYHRVLSTPNMTFNDSAKDSNKDVSSFQASKLTKSNSQTESVVPIPPPLMPVLKPVGERKGVRFLPAPSADPRDQLMSSIRSFSKDNLKSVSK